MGDTYKKHNNNLLGNMLVISPFIQGPKLLLCKNYNLNFTLFIYFPATPIYVNDLIIVIYNKKTDIHRN